MTLNELLFDAIGDIGELDGEMIRAAEDPPKRRRGSRAWAVLIPAAAAAAVLAALILPGRLAGRTEDKLTTEEISSLEIVTAYYDGTLLAENMVNAGARITGIRLSHSEGTELADASGWETLSFKVELEGERIDMSCSFDPEADMDLDWTPTDTAEYNGAVIYLYIEEFTEWEERYKYSCKAAFLYDGVLYDLSLHLKEPQDIYIYLDLLMGVSGEDRPQGGEDSENRPFESVLGFEDYRVTLEEYLPYQYEWHCWVTMDGEERCVAENVFLFEDGFAAYSVDLDGDGVPELVTNNVFTTGTQRVYVFQYRSGEILRGSPDRDFYRKDLGFADVYGENAIEERYDPEANVFVATFLENGEERTESFAGLEHFVFRPFEHWDY